MVGLVEIHTHLGLEEVAKLVSPRLAGGAPFGGKDDYVCEEFPAVYVDRLLGGRLVLYGFGGSEGYQLSFSPKWFPSKALQRKATETQHVDISTLMAALLQDIEGIKVEALGGPTPFPQP